MAIIPGGKRFIGISESVDLTEKKSALVNSKTEPYTMSDIVDTVAASGGGGKFVDGTNPLDAVYTTGNVGIGTTTPTEALQVVGKISLNDGGNSVYLGDSAGTNDVTANNRNVGIGGEALDANTTGVSNVAIGYQSLRLNTNGAQNASVGTFSLWSNVGGISNTAIGYQSLFFNTTGSNNVASGYRSLRSNTSAISNVAIGYEALIDTTTGNENVALGTQAGENNTIGANNVFLGTQAGSLNTTGANNVFLGAESGPLSVNQDNQIVIGFDAVGNGSNTVTIGNPSIVATVLRGTLNLANLPTSATGLSAGDVWRSGNDLKIV